MAAANADARGLSVARGRYRLGDLVGRGSFGCVHRVTGGGRSDLVGKCELRDSSAPQLEYERRVLALLAPSGATPPPVWWGTTRQWRVLIMQDRGRSLEALRLAAGGRLPATSACAIAARLIDALRVVHDRGIVHRDLKPENVLLDSPSPAMPRLTLIDFGLSKKYLRRDGRHIAPSHGASLRGTPRFVSLSVHDGHSASRRDDVESAMWVDGGLPEGGTSAESGPHPTTHGPRPNHPRPTAHGPPTRLRYLLGFLANGTLPWVGVRAPAGIEDERARRRARNRLIGDAKRRCTPQVAMGSLPPAFARWLQLVRNLSYAERPEYERMHSAFIEAQPPPVARRVAGGGFAFST